MFDVISIGGATRDIFFEIDELAEKRSKSREFLEIPYGSKLVADATYYSYGGGAANTSVAFSRLGLKSAAFCNIGKEGTGSLLFNHLKKEGVATSLVHRDAILHTGLSVFILGREREHTGFLERGANNHLAIERKTPLKKTRWYYVSSLTGSSAHLLPEIFNIGKKKNIKIAFNPGSRQIIEGYHGLRPFLEQTEVLLLNSEEASDLVFSKIKKRPNKDEELLKELSKMGPKTVVVTEGEKGSFAITGGETYHQCAYSENVIDTTGAGDAFGSTFVFGMIRGLGVPESLKIAAVNSASVVAKMGATEGLLSYNSIRSSKWL